VIDDEDSICKFCSSALEGAGFEVCTTTIPQRAVELVQTESFDAVLTDVKMPGMTGLQLLQQIRQFSPDIAVVMMTGYATLEVAINAVRGGAQQFIHKPFAKDELVLCVESALERQRLLQENIRLKTLVNLFKVSESLSSTLDVSELLRLVLSAALHETKAEGGVIFLPDDYTKELYIRHAEGLPEGHTETARFLQHKGLLGRIFLRKRPMVLERGTMDFHRHDLIQEEKGAAGYPILGVPLKHQNRALGVLLLFRKVGASPFTKADLDAATILANHASTAMDNAELVFDLEILFLETLKSLAKTVDERDPYTHGHSQRVARLAVGIGEKLGLPESELEVLEFAGILHDIGKIGIRDEILLKPGRLTPEEYEIIKTHPERGYNILKHIRRLSPVVQAVYTHHEWYDGRGYPRGLKGDEIPLAGAILAVADAFDTMITDRPYQPRRSPLEALHELRARAGTQFHPKVVEALEQIDLSQLCQAIAA